MDEAADTGDDHRPEQRERIEPEPEREAVRPSEQRDVDAVPRRGRLPERERAEEREQHGGAADDAGAAAQLRAEHPQQQRAEQRQEPDRGEHHPRSAATSSMSTLLARRNVASTMASPIAASAAATVITTNTNTCPALLSQARANASIARFAAFHMSSIAISTISGLRRVSTPATPIRKMTAESPM